MKYKSCFDGYLTDACAKCGYWKDGSDPNGGVGCCCPFPIMDCKAFAEMFNEQERIAEKERTSYVKPACIKLSSLYKMLKLFVKEKGHKLDKILIHIGNIEYHLYSIFDMDDLVCIEDVRIINNSGLRTIVFYGYLNPKNMPEVEITNSTTVGQLLSVIYHAFTQDRFIPNVTIIRTTDGSIEEYRHEYDLFDLKNPNRIIRYAAIDFGSNKKGISCKIALKTY